MCTVLNFLIASDESPKKYVRHFKWNTLLSALERLFYFNRHIRETIKPSQNEINQYTMEERVDDEGNTDIHGENKTKE